ncbi:MAG TPA: SpoIIE family protein phosphatase [Candidatus Angelobacter sp.]|nr:SpoIIE family protein phosphatase [Candidatus Angelobacter sp.]
MSDAPQLWLEEPAPEPRTGPLYLGVQGVNVFVRDIDRSLQFYVEQLGFEVVSDVIIQSGQRRVGVAPPDGTAVITLIAPEPDSEEYKSIGKPTHIVFVTEDVPAKYLEWRKRGVKFGHTPRLRRIKYQQHAAARRTKSAFGADDPPPVWGGVFTRFEDPDRNSFSLVCLDEVSRAITAQRRAAAEKAESERRAARELEIAKEVQLKLFPQTLPTLRTLEYAGTCIQAHQVGGDYYDFLDMGRDHLGLVLSDISGKGIAAALLMANLQANLRTQFAVALDDPERFLRSVNQLFCENTADNAYASMFFAIYHDQSQRLRYANCGHLSGLLLRRDGSLERLDSNCTVLGLFPDWKCAMSDCLLCSGDTLALYTDGVTESMNQKLEEFGEERLVEILQCHRDLCMQELISAIVGKVQSFSGNKQFDDITLIVARGK